MSSVLALAGGVGGAKLASGLHALLAERLTVLVNTGDDFEHLGLHVSPDLDTVAYTLAGVANPITGWGLREESWNFMSQLAHFGGANWFKLGDRDLAAHVIRADRLRHGESLSAITKQMCNALSIRAKVLPMSDDRVSTMIRSGDQVLAFQDYFVRLKCAIPVTEIYFEGIAEARYNRELDSLASASETLTVIICPSNPYLSIDPILALPRLRQWLKNHSSTIIAVSPIVRGNAIKGPAAKIMSELGVEVSACSIANHYKGLIDGFIVDDLDSDLADQIGASGIRVQAAQTIMRTTAEREELARICLDFAERLRSERSISRCTY